MLLPDPSRRWSRPKEWLRPKQWLWTGVAVGLVAVLAAVVGIFGLLTPSKAALSFPVPTPERTSVVPVLPSVPVGLGTAIAQMTTAPTPKAKHSSTSHPSGKSKTSVKTSGSASPGAAAGGAPSPSNPSPSNPSPSSTSAGTGVSGGSDPSGQPMPVGNLPGWKQVYTDDFAQQSVPLGKFPAAASSQWRDYPDGWSDTTGNGKYEPSQVVSIHNGVMDLDLHTQNGVHSVAAPEPVIPGATGSDGGLLYGRYSIRFKSDPVPGYKTAWLLWPDSNQWSDGEIDFPEGNLDSTLWAYMHYRGNPTSQDAYPSGATYGAWHTATIDWTPSAVTFYLDGRVIGSSTNASTIPNTPMHLVLQTETQLSGGAPSDSAAGHVYIAWVVIYSMT